MKTSKKERAALAELRLAVTRIAAANDAIAKLDTALDSLREALTVAPAASPWTAIAKQEIARMDAEKARREGRRVVSVGDVVGALRMTGPCKLRGVVFELFGAGHSQSSSFARATAQALQEARQARLVDFSITSMCWHVMPELKQRRNRRSA